MAPTPRYNHDGMVTQITSMPTLTERGTATSSPFVEKRSSPTAEPKAGSAPGSMLPKQRQSSIGVCAHLPAELFTKGRYLHEQSGYRGPAALLGIHLALALIDIYVVPSVRTRDSHR